MDTASWRIVTFTVSMCSERRSAVASQGSVLRRLVEHGQIFVSRGDARIGGVAMIFQRLVGHFAVDATRHAHGT